MFKWCYKRCITGDYNHQGGFLFFVFIDIIVIKQIITENQLNVDTNKDTETSDHSLKFSIFLIILDKI